MAVLNINQENFKEIINGEKAVLIDYWAPWCSYCRRIAPAYEKIGEQYGEDLIIAKVNIDENPELARQEEIEVIPTLVLYKNGEPADSIVAPESKAKIDELIRRNS